MDTIHTLAEYADALRGQGLLLSCTADDALMRTRVTCLTYDTRTIDGTALFLCKGSHFKEEYIRQAAESGAIAYVAEREYGVDVPHLIVSDIRAAMAALGRLFCNDAMDRLVGVGITGTKGKSTTVYYMRYILDAWLTAEGRPRCGLISSIDTYDGVADTESHITTPEILALYEHYANAVRSGITHFVTEVSSQALKYRRVEGIRFRVGCMLNIGLDHISPIEHTDFEDYYTSKLKIFDHCEVGCVNTDAAEAERTLAYARARCRVVTFGSHESDDVYGSGIEKRSDGIYFTVRSARYNGEFSITMPGIFNVSNALAAIAMSMVLGVPEQAVRMGLRAARANGRMEVYHSRDGEVVVVSDYAHNTLSFDALYRSAQTEYPGYQIIGVFGAAGGKALGRRRELGSTASKYADYIFVTEDDPGEEPLAQITAQIAQHVTCPYEINHDRGDCIRKAVLEHTGKRVILCTGKGNETTMKRGTEYVPVPTDAQWAVKYLKEYDERQKK